MARDAGSLWMLIVAPADSQPASKEMDPYSYNHRNGILPMRMSSEAGFSLESPDGNSAQPTP